MKEINVFLVCISSLIPIVSEREADSEGGKPLGLDCCFVRSRVRGSEDIPLYSIGTIVIIVWHRIVYENKTPCTRSLRRKQYVRQSPHQADKFGVSMQRFG
jgi:hypothetical protein